MKTLLLLVLMIIDRDGFALQLAVRAAAAEPSAPTNQR